MHAERTQPRNILGLCRDVGHGLLIQDIIWYVSHWIEKCYLLDLIAGWDGTGYESYHYTPLYSTPSPTTFPASSDAPAPRATQLKSEIRISKSQTNRKFKIRNDQNTESPRF